MKKIIFTLLFLAVSAQLVFACPMHDEDGSGKKPAGDSSGKAEE